MKQSRLKLGRPTGRPRLPGKKLDQLIDEYCRRFNVARQGTGLPPRPKDAQGTSQFASYERLRNAHQRRLRRERGQCARCDRPVSPPSTFCETHRAAGAARAGKHKATVEERRALHAAQVGLCPICAKPVGLWDALDHSHETTKLRGLLHPDCNFLIGFVERAATDDIDALAQRIAAYLWPPEPV